jgi:hypothetical protein
VQEDRRSKVFGNKNAHAKQTGTEKLHFASLYLFCDFHVWQLESQSVSPPHVDKWRVDGMLCFPSAHHWDGLKRTTH